MFEWLIVSSFQLIFGSVENSVYKTFVRQRNGWCCKSSLPNNLGLILVLLLFKIVMLCSVHLYMIRETCFLLKYGLWKLQLDCEIRIKSC